MSIVINISNEQLRFLETEFRLSGNDVSELGCVEVNVLREKCFDIEVEEAMKAESEDKDISDRGTVAADIVDSLMAYMKSAKKAVV